MQNFLPYPDVEKSVKCLDRQRLVKQNLETRQCLNALLGLSKGWVNHPAVRAYKGHERFLFNYGLKVNEECVRRGYKNSADRYEVYKPLLKDDDSSPTWFGREDIHSSHRGRLKCKGQIDVYCAAIKSGLKIKSIDDWLKANYRKSKNQLRYKDFPALLAKIKEIKAEELVQNNYYDKFSWTESPELEYIWPV